MADEQKLPCTFTGFSISRKEKGDIVQDQHKDLMKLEKLHVEVKGIASRSMQMKLA